MSPPETASLPSHEDTTSINAEGIESSSQTQNDKLSLLSKSKENENTKVPESANTEEGKAPVGSTTEIGQETAIEQTEDAGESHLPDLTTKSGSSSEPGNLLGTPGDLQDGTAIEATVAPPISTSETASKAPGTEQEEAASEKAAPVEKGTNSPQSEEPPLMSLSEDAVIASPSPPPPPPKDERYLYSEKDPVDTPARSPSPSARAKEKAPAREEELSEKHGEAGIPDDRFVEDSQSEIQSIMEQFDEGMPAPGAEEIMSPRLEIANPLLTSPLHPPRKSSLEPLMAAGIPITPHSPNSIQSPPPRISSLSDHSEMLNEKALPPEPSSAPGSPQSIFKLQKPQPDPDPEPDLPFDFHRFLEQLRHRTADPVAKFLRSFLQEFAKKQWMVHEQVKIIGDFLEFITKKMGQCEVWRTVSEQEFDNAREGMEKLVMNRLYTQTFSPAIPSPELEPASKGRRRPQSPTKPGRRGQHQEDVERDEVLAQKIRIYKWVREEHLDIKPVGDKGRKFLVLAQQELLKIKSYRAPRDKVICILNCCKVIFGFLKSAQKDQSADSFVPLLIYVVLQANPDHLVSNVQYILRFRHQDKLGGEAGYYISSLMGAVQFIENLDRTSLTITDEEFEKHVEEAVSAIAERPNPFEDEAAPLTQATPSLDSALQPALPARPSHRRLPSPHNGLPISEKSALSRPEVTPRNSLDAERAHAPRRSTSQRTGASPTVSKGGATQENAAAPEPEDTDAVSGLLRTIQRPLSTIGRIFSDAESSPSSHPALTPQPGNTPRLSPAPRRSSDDPRRRSGDGPAGTPAKPASTSADLQAVQRLSAEDAAARQASAEAEEARKIQRREHKVVVDTLAGMFPMLDREIIDDVVRMKEGRVGLAVDACLALTNP